MLSLRRLGRGGELLPPRRWCPQAVAGQAGRRLPWHQDGTPDGALGLGRAAGEERLHIGGGKGNIWFPAGRGCPLGCRHQVADDGRQDVGNRRILISQG
jgi:hypothetical protein